MHLGRELKKLGKRLVEDGLPLVGNALFQGHGNTVKSVLGILGAKDNDTEEAIIQKLTPEALAQIEAAKLESQYNLHELEFKREELATRNFEIGQRTIGAMLTSSDWYTRNAVPTIIWIFAASCGWQFVLAPMLLFLTNLAGATFAIPELVTLQLPTLDLPEWYSSLVPQLFGIAMLKRSAEKFANGKN